MERLLASENKRGYTYLLTREGIRAKIELTEKFVEIKKREYEMLKEDLERLQGREWPTIVSLSSV